MPFFIILPPVTTHLYHTMSQKSSVNRLRAGFLLLLFSLASPSIAWAQKPNDPQVEQWAFRDTKAYEAWDITTGSRDVVVAVIDDGFDMFHPDLYENTWKNVEEIPDNGLDDDMNGYTDDVWGWNFVAEDVNNDGKIDEREIIGNNDPRPQVVFREAGTDLEAVHHGTLVAGIIGAVGNNSIAGAGVNWHVRLMNIKVLGNSGIGNVIHMSRAIHYAVDNGADVINFSLIAEADAGLSEAVEYAYNHGVAVVGAIGNNGMGLEQFPRYPACVDGPGEQRILGVSAIGMNHQLAYFSNFGSSCVDITAPGIHIGSTVRYAPQYGFVQLYDDGWQGTSFAAPFVTGAAALIKSIRPEWGPKEIYDAILKNVHKTPPIDEAAYANLFGAGLLQIDKAVAYAASGAATIVRVADMRSRDAYQVNPKIDTLRSVDGVLPVFDDVAVLPGQGEYEYVTIKQRDKKISDIRVYSPAWKEMRSWQVPSLGASTIVTGDVDDRPGQEIIIAPLYGDTTLYRVYAADGTLLKTVSTVTKTKHAGVRMSIAHPADRDEVVTLFAQGKTVTLSQYDKTGKVSQTIRLPQAAAQDKPFAADINKDGILEYIRVSPGGQVTVIDREGALVLSYAAYANSGKLGVTSWIGDVDRDGQVELVVSPIDASGPVRAFSLVGRKINEWTLPAQVSRQVRIFAE